MTILHLNSYFIDNHLYGSLYRSLDGQCNQRVYIPMKFDRKPENAVDLPSTELHFDQVIRKDHKFRFWHKIRSMTKRVIEKNLHKDVDFVHAHNLYNDGVVAYQLKKKFGIPYIVAIRSTDVGLQYKLMIQRRPYIHKVLANADRIIFISETYQSQLEQMLPPKWKAKLAPKFQLIPNGIDAFWHQNRRDLQQAAREKSFGVLYVGQLQQRKHILELIDAVDEINSTPKGPMHLVVVGGPNGMEEEYHQQVLRAVEASDAVEYKGRIQDKAELLECYRSASCFAMVSEYELFGLVYIEALSQGLPVIYKAGEGISGYLQNAKAGIAVEGVSKEDIKEALLKCKEDYGQFEIEPSLVQPFNWQDIASIYLNLYHRK